MNGEEIAFENGRISDFKGLLTLTLTLRSGHTAYCHLSLIDLYLPNFIEIEETFCGRTDIWNELDTKLKEETSPTQFKSLLKLLLMIKLYSDY